VILGDINRHVGNERVEYKRVTTNREFREKKKKICLVFIDLEKAYDKRSFKIGTNEKRGPKNKYRFNSGYV
jgi:hypothetical protein